VVDIVADGMSTAAFLDTYPNIESDDSREALVFAAEAVRKSDLLLTTS
jgi:uncharacterized protein (DUF433 family)